jgi:hypothetical protein
MITLKSTTKHFQVLTTCLMRLNMLQIIEYIVSRDMYGDKEGN